LRLRGTHYTPPAHADFDMDDTNPKAGDSAKRMD
jgi:hypothetical protein